jgi:mannose-6-phosphate isomerase-like protein (cupin superfamily)
MRIKMFVRPTEQLWALMLVGFPFVSSAEIKDVMKSSDIDAVLAQSKQGERPLHIRPNFGIWAGVREGKALPVETRKEAGTVLHIRKGGGRFTVARREHEITAGDVLHIPRNAAYQIDPGSGRIEYLAIRVFGDNPSRSVSSDDTRQIPDVLKKAVIDATFAKNKTNQPIGSTSAYSTNYVIYAGRQSPWETHAACVDIYVIKAGSGVTQIGGKISNPKEESPGEMRGDGVVGARSYNIAAGDVVVIPRLEAHHQEPQMPILGYILLKVWTE